MARIFRQRRLLELQALVFGKQLLVLPLQPYQADVVRPDFPKGQSAPMQDFFRRGHDGVDPQPQHSHAGLIGFRGARQPGVHLNSHQNELGYQHHGQHE